MSNCGVTQCCGNVTRYWGKVAHERIQLPGSQWSHVELVSLQRQSAICYARTLQATLSLLPQEFRVLSFFRLISKRQCYVRS